MRLSHLTLSLSIALMFGCKSDKGEAGPAGEDGAPGETGPAGEDGADGEDGEDESSGPPAWCAAPPCEAPRRSS